MTEQRRYDVVQKMEADGIEFEICEYHDRRHVVTLIPTGQSDASGNPLSVPMMEHVKVRQIKATLSGGTVIFEPGAMQYYRGEISVSVIRHEDKGLIARIASSAGTGESAYGTSFKGTGEFWAEPTRRHFILADVDTTINDGNPANGDGSSVVLDDKAFYACSGGVKLSTYTHKNVMGVLSSGNGLMQPMLSGKGAFVVVSPVPVDEIEEIELKGGKLVVDGDYMLMYTKSLNPRIGPLVSGIRNAYRSGEGIVYHFEGHGTVWLMPTMKVA